MTILSDKRILLGVTAGIAAYKSCELVRLLRKAGAEVHVVMTPNATQLVGSETFRSLSGNPVAVETYAGNEDHRVKHIDLADAAELAVIAPCTTNTLGKLVHGLADNLLLTVFQAVTCPVLLCPSANVHMISHPAVQANLLRANEMGYIVLAPEEGDLACGYHGTGRMPEPVTILEALERILVPRTPLAGKRVLITAGPTREPIDAVRVLTNRSSGQMGYALAEAALAMGAQVDLVSGPVALEPPPGARLHRVETALEMQAACRELFPGADLTIGAAAVADYRLETPVDGKIKRSNEPLTLQLIPNPDILAELGHGKKKGQIVVGFALEVSSAIPNAKAKLIGKSLDMIVLNDATEPGAGFDTSTNHVFLIFHDGRQEEIPLDSKPRVAMKILDAILPLMGKKR